MRIAIVGSRGYADLDAVRRFVAWLPKGTTIVSGGARGVDALAVSEALLRGLKTEVHKPDWKTYGPRAGFVRNRLIIQKADVVVAFWDGKSGGTADSIALARELCKEVRLFIDPASAPPGNKRHAKPVSKHQSEQLTSPGERAQPVARQLDQLGLFTGKSNEKRWRP